MSRIGRGICQRIPRKALLHTQQRRYNLKRPSTTGRKSLSVLPSSSAVYPELVDAALKSWRAEGERSEARQIIESFKNKEVK